MKVQSTKVTGPKGEVWLVQHEYVPPLDDEIEDDDPSPWVVQEWRNLADAAWGLYQVYGPGVLVFDLPERGVIGAFRNYVSEAAPLCQKLTKGKFRKALRTYDPARQVMIVLATNDFYELRCFVSVVPDGNAILPPDASAARDDTDTARLDPEVWGDLLRDLNLPHELNPSEDDKDEDDNKG